MPKVVTKVRTGGLGLDGADFISGRRRSPLSALERKLTWMAVALEITG